MQSRLANVSTPQLPTRQANQADRAAITRVLVPAFWDDPVWGPMFPAEDETERRHQASEFWDFMVGEALHYPDTYVATGPDGSLAAVAVWYPPGAAEIRDEMLPAYDSLTLELLGEAGAAAVHDSGDRFDAERPKDPHAYLNFLAVAPEWRGHGIGMALLRETRARYDAAGIPSYLESTNPGNDARYEREGYRAHGKVVFADGGAATTFWRDAE